MLIAKKDILIVGEGPTQRWDDTALTAEKSIQSTLQNIIKKNLFELAL